VDPALVGVLGTLSGVVAGGGLGHALDRARWKREDRVRWYADRRSLYTNFARAIDDLDQATIHLNALRFSEDEAAKARARERADQAVDRLKTLKADVSLVGGTEVRGALGRLLTSASILLGAARLGLVPADEEAEAERGNYDEALIDFRRSARKEIGLSPD
jgi:hypothetical protein